MTTKWRDIRARGRSEAEMERIEREAAEMFATAEDLKELREFAGKTQVDLAELLDIGQGDVSKLENREDWKVSTIRRYVEALGGELEINAVFGRKKIRLQTPA